MRIVICEDSVLLREGLVRLLDDAGHEIVAALPDARALASTVSASTPDLVIVDVRMPPTFTDEGIQAAIRLRRDHPRVAVLVLSQYVEERYAADLVASGGAFGYLLKDRVADVTDFLASVEAVGTGSTVLDPEVVAQLLARRGHDDRMARLTSRERAVLALMAEGRSNQSIANALHLSIGGVEKHISSLFRSLDLEHDDGDNRRVLAVLVHLDSTGGSRD